MNRTNDVETKNIVDAFSVKLDALQQLASNPRFIALQHDLELLFPPDVIVTLDDVDWPRSKTLVVGVHVRDHGSIHETTRSIADVLSKRYAPWDLRFSVRQRTPGAVWYEDVIPGVFIVKPTALRG